MKKRPPKPTPVTITVEDLAALAGLNRKTIYDLVGRGELPGVRRIGRSIRIHKESVLVWLAGQDRDSRSSKGKKR